MSSKNTASLFDVLDAVSHDLKSPLASILSVISLIQLKKEKITCEELDEYLARAEEKAQFLNENIDALFVTGAILEKKLELQKHPIDLQKLFVRLKYSFKKVSFPVLKKPVTVVGDKEWLPKVLITIFQHIERLKIKNTPISIILKNRQGKVILKVQYEGESLAVDSFELEAFLPHVTKTVRLSLYTAVVILRKLGGELQIEKNTITITLESYTQTRAQNE